MVSKKETETGAVPGVVKKRYLSNAQCKATAARISAEMREDREGREHWGHQWAAYVPIDGKTRLPGGSLAEHTRGKKPLHLVIPGDFDQAKAVIEHLYHLEEAAAIIGALTP